LAPAPVPILCAASVVAMPSHPSAALTVLALASAPLLAVGRLGGGSGGDSASGAEAESRLSDNSSVLVPSPQSLGYVFAATSTQYGQTPAAACGGVDTVKLVKGTGYIAVASAQSMQSLYTSYGGCGAECHDETGKQVESCEYSQCASNTAKQGCKCKQVGACWCGQSSPEIVASTGTASMGCFSCARARFLRERPYNSDSANPVEDSEFVGEEVKIVVADSCPYAPNSQWCPARPGDVNSCGMKNHFDFTAYPAGLSIDNNFVVFTPEPCSAELQQRINATSKCSR